MQEHNEGGRLERNPLEFIKNLHREYIVDKASYEAHIAELATGIKVGISYLSKEVPKHLRADILLEISDSIQLDSTPPDQTVFTFEGERILSYSFPNEQIQPVIEDLTTNSQMWLDYAVKIGDEMNRRINSQD